MTTFFSRIIKASVIFSLAGLLMGNKSCEKKPAQPEPRSLRKIVDVGTINSPPIKLPDGNAFDLRFVVNQQLYNVLYESKAFAFRDKSPVVGLSMASDGSILGRLNVGPVSRAFFEKTMNKPSAQMVVPSKLAYCLMNKPQARIGGEVISFELLGGGGAHLGFNQLGEHSGGGIGGSFKVDVYQLELQMRALSPMTKATLSNVSFRTNKTDQAGSFDLIIGQFSAGTNYYYNTPMAKVTRRALEGAVNLLKVDLEKNNNDWFSRVLYLHESEKDLVAIIGGTNVGMQIGDQLAIYNEITYWADEPCNSNISQDGGSLGDPVAIVQISDVSPEVSSGYIIQTMQDYNPAYIPGAKIKVHKLKSNDVPGISQSQK